MMGVGASELSASIGVVHQAALPARNTLDSARIPRASKLLICGLFLKGRVLAQDGEQGTSRLDVTQ